MRRPSVVLPTASRHGGLWTVALLEPSTIRIPSAVLAASFALIIACGSSSGDAAPPSRTVIALGAAAGCAESLDLKATDRRRLSDSRLVAGVSGSPQGDIAYWGRGLGAFLLRGGADPVPLTGGVDAIAVAFDGSHWSVVFDAPMRIGRYSQEGKPDGIAPVRLPAGGGQLHAVYVQNQWRLLTHRDGGVSMFAISGSETKLLAEVRSTFLDDSSAASDATAAANGDILVSQRDWPYGAVVIDALGNSTVLDNFTATGALDTPDIDPRTWFALPLLDVGCGFIQTLADVGTTRRLLLVRDYSGRLRRYTAISAPMGFLASRPTDSTLLAISTLDFREVVTYRWRY